MTKLEIGGFAVTVDNERVTCDDAITKAQLETSWLPMSGYKLPVEYQIVMFAVTELKGKLISGDEINIMQPLPKGFNY